MKVCFLLGGFYQNGGIGRVTSMIANRLSIDNRFEIRTLSYYDSGKTNIYHISKSITQDFLMEEYQSMTKFIIKGGEFKLRNYLRNNKIDILIACGALYFPISVRAAKSTNTKVICWEHSDPKGSSDHRGQNIARKYGIKRSSLNIVLTKSAKDIYCNEYGVKNTIQIYNPIDEELSKHSKIYNICSKKIISVGRLSYQKHFDAVIEIASIVLPNHPDWEWDIYGQGEDLSVLKKLSDEKGVSNQVHFKGQVNDLYDRYSDYAMMVMTSRYEGFPMSLLEGMANGLPLISFDVPTGPNEIIIDGATGYLIKAEDINDMAHKIDYLIKNFALRVQMSQNAVNSSQRFAETEIIEVWKKILFELI